MDKTASPQETRYVCLQDLYIDEFMGFLDEAGNTILIADLNKD